MSRDRVPYRHFVTAMVSILALTACADPAPVVATTQRTLVDHRQWRHLDAEDDPLASHQPATIACGLSGVYTEFGHLEVNTGRCNYAWIEHPALLDIDEGSQILTQLTHYDLEAEPPGEAHVAIYFGDALQWETTIAVPHPADVLPLEFQATHALEVGDPIRVHLHNHGQNSWSLAPVMADVPTP